ncbi:MAG: hypothetical protein CBB60_005995 [Armatimonadetes bacterium Cent15-Ar3]|nr:MAG: hypothetical protein CBB60_005995 [Armatimonadetes bacterium Cent15-Ar3]
MNEENPYQPPGTLSEPITSIESYASDSTYYRTPPTFWVAWGCMVTLCVLALGGVLSLGEAMIGPPLTGLLLAVFVAFRCQLCERYQHRCMTYGGVRIFFQCFVVCFGFGYLALGVAFGLYTWLTSVFRSSNVTTAGRLYGLEILPAFVAGSLAIAAYLKLIQMSASRPTISAPHQKL